VLGDDLADVRGAVRDRIGALRHLITQMRPLALDLLGPGPALEDLVRRASEVGDPTGRCDVRELPALRPEAALGVYRVVQEAVTNAVRHCGGTTVEVRAQVRGRRLHVLVTDDGTGPPGDVAAGSGAGGSDAATGGGSDGGSDGLDGSGLGIPGMTERARALGGRVTLTPAAVGGTVVDLDLPLADVGVPAGPSGRDRQPAGVLAR
ncbi:MAG: ATP-binding protein, partial [Actinobacteria bacterium]|nr:ATP-binding protein [Actinomycetota bacterium]